MINMMDFELEIFFERSNAYCSKCFLEMSIMHESAEDIDDGSVYTEAEEGLLQKIWNTIKSMIQALKIRFKMQ